MTSLLPKLPGWAPPGLSIRQVLLAITAALSLMIALLAGRELWVNFDRLDIAQDLRAAISVSDELFDATGKISIERDLAVSMLQTNDAETIEALRQPLEESRRAADLSVSNSLAAIDRSRQPEFANLRGQLERRHGEIRALRTRVDGALFEGRRRRDAGLVAQWEATTTAVMGDIAQLWAAFTQPFTNVDPVITQHLRYRHLLRAITDYTGRERSIIGQILSENADPTPEQTAELLRTQGILEQDWALTRTIAEQSGLYDGIAAEYVDAESHYATVHDMTREMFYVPGVRRGNVVYPIGPDFWFELSSQASESLAALRDASRQATQTYLGDVIARTERAILTQILISIAALLLCAASFWVIAVRVIGPIGRIVDALTRASRGEGVDFAIGTGRNDEIGKLAAVLHAFQDNVEEVKRSAVARDEAARRLEGEVVIRRNAEQKAQQQLERLALLHKISRAIGERQDLGSIFQVAAANVEERMPADFVCVCVRDGDGLVVTKVGPKGAYLAHLMDMPEGARIEVDANGLSRCMMGRLVYEPDLADRDFPFPRRLANGGLTAFVAAPLQVESSVFGALIAARSQSGFSSGECEFLRQLSEHVALAAHQAQLNAALKQAYDELRQTQEAAMQQERLKALGQMASGIAHDINNALSPIALYTESLLNTEPALTTAGRGKLEVVQRAIDDAARTIARMSDFYRKRDKASALTPVEPNTLVRQVLDLTQARWRDMPQSRGEVIEIKTELLAVPAAIMGVESELREALTNLVFNAVDAMPGSGIVTLRTKRNEAGSVQIEIEDNGVGMDETTRQRCLEPFFTTKGERGTGLGLAMVYGTVQRHGGAVEIESELGKGTLIRLSFASAAGASARGERAIEVRPRARLNLLVVDDDPVLLRSLRDVLEHEGHVVTAADGGAAGVDAFTAAQQQAKIFDAVITDLGMPGVDGRRVASAIKLASPQTPVILLTGWGERLRAEEEKFDDIDHILSKPPKLGDIRAALAASCGAEIAANAARRR
jgi:signal transduction histidine kinase/CheY-like chemotaxis protein